MTRPIGNVRLKAARQHAGYPHSKPSPMRSPAQPRSSDSGTWRSAPARYGGGSQPTRRGRGQTTSGCSCTCSSSRSKTSASRHRGRYRWPVPTPP